MASGPITSWQIDREKVETVTDFMSCKIITDSDLACLQTQLLGCHESSVAGRCLAVPPAEPATGKYHLSCQGGNCIPST